MKHRNMNQWVEVMVKGSIFFYLFTFLPLACPDFVPYCCGDARGGRLAS